MNLHARRRLGASALGTLLCALLITWGIKVADGPGSVVQAQQDNWTTDLARRNGIRLLETRAMGGTPAYPVQAGDLLFFTNAGTSFGATNKIDSIVVINAKTKKPIAMSALEPEWAEGFISHGVGVSPDGKYVYLPGQAPSKAKNPSRLLVLDARTLKIHQIIASGAERPHHVKDFEDWTGKARVLVEDFNWTDNSPNGKGFFVLDHTDQNKVVAGMTPADLRGNPYAGFTSPDGRYLYYSMPANDRDIRDDLDGYLVKIDMQTWKIVQSIALDSDPIWTTFTQDGKFAWVSLAFGSKAVKIQRATEPGQKDKVVGEAPTGPGPYGLTFTLGDKELWSADKGESTPRAKIRTTVTIIDPETNQQKRTIETGCRTNDHLILSPDGQEMWATCNGSQEIVVLDTKTYAIKTRIPMPNQGDSHGGIFVSYTAGSGGLVAEVVSDQNGLHGTAREARRNGVPWVQAGSR